MASRWKGPISERALRGPTVAVVVAVLAVASVSGVLVVAGEGDAGPGLGCPLPHVFGAPMYAPDAQRFDTPEEAAAAIGANLLGLPEAVAEASSEEGLVALEADGSTEALVTVEQDDEGWLGVRYEMCDHPEVPGGTADIPESQVDDAELRDYQERTERRSPAPADDASTGDAEEHEEVER